MLRLFTNRTTTACCRIYFSPRRLFSSQHPSCNPENSTNHHPQQLKHCNHIPPPPILHHATPLSPAAAPYSLSRISLFAFSTIAAAASLSVLFSQNDESGRETNHIYVDVQRAVDRSNESVRRILNTMKQTGVAASVLWKSLWSVLSSANHEVRLGFEVRVAALLADIAAANESRRRAIVGAEGGRVLDWLLDKVAVAGDSGGTQTESARALAYLIADPNVCQAVLGRPGAVPNLLRFIFSAQPQAQQSKKVILRIDFIILYLFANHLVLYPVTTRISNYQCSLAHVSVKSPLFCWHCLVG